MMSKFEKMQNPLGLMKISACASALLASFLLFSPIMASASKATDMSASTSGDVRLIRMGLNKSMVVQLPRDAKDVVVGNTEIVDAVVRTKNVAYLFARNIGQTNVFFFDANGQQLLNVNLEVAIDTTAIQKLLQRQLPGTHITVDSAGTNVILAGVAMNPLEAKTAEDLANQLLPSATSSPTQSKVINAIKIAGEDQVMLQVKVVEVQRDVLKQLGVNLKALLDVGGFALNFSGVNPFANNSISDNAAAGASGVSGTSNFSAIVRAMESDGLLRTLAEPNLTALSGQPASFLAGGEYPYTLCDYSSKPPSCTVSFKNYGVGLNFTPVVLSKGRINLKIHTEVSELNTIQTGNQNVPSINKRSADTTLEMPDGGSMMLAGLIRESTRQTINGTPGLKNVPVLGALFRSRDFINNQTELVVIVTPHIVRSVAQRQLETPDEGFNPATDRQTLLMGRLNKVYGSAGKAPKGDYQGNVGFIVE